MKFFITTMEQKSCPRLIITIDAIKIPTPTMKNCLSVIAVATLLCFGFTPASFAATATVSVGSALFAFTPATTNINAGDRVIWVWGGTFHSTTSGTVSGTVATPNGLWESGVITTLPHSFTNTFNSAGTFPYYCSIHFNSGMKGTIIVTAPNSPPTVSITNPINNAVFAEPANVTIQASATDSDGTVTNVQFLVGSTILTNTAIAPFFAVASNLITGAYILSAVASDNNGGKATNTVAISVVTAVMPTIGGLQPSPPANFQFSYSANVGLHYVVERSADLGSASWIAISTNTAASDPQTFVDANATNSPGFYRVRLLPNP